MYTLSGACDAQGDINGMPFVKQGTTLSGAPYYKALSAERFLYHDPNGTPRWVLDCQVGTHDPEGDFICDYIGYINSQYTIHPPTAGEWTMRCAGGVYQQQFVFLVEGTTTMTVTTTTPAKPTTTTSRNDGNGTTKSTKASLTLGGACAYKHGLNGLIFDAVSMAADGSPIYKARGIEEYIYHDVDCDGAGSNTAARWLIGNIAPSLTATKDLDGDGKCTYHARLDSARVGTSRPPAYADWIMYCNGDSGWMSVELTLQEVSGGDAKATNDLMINSATRNVIVATVAAVSLVTAQALFA